MLDADANSKQVFLYFALETLCLNIGISHDINQDKKFLFPLLA